MSSQRGLFFPENYLSFTCFAWPVIQQQQQIQIEFSLDKSASTYMYFSGLHNISAGYCILG